MSIDLQEWARRKGYRVAAGPSEVIRHVQATIRDRRDRGELDRRFAGTWLGWLDGPAPAREEPPVSVLAIAVPSPACRVRFTLDSGMLAATIPPTYSEDDGADESLMADLAASFPVLQSALRPVRVARKALAVRLGLSEYGVNNITYTPGLGSYVRLAVLESTVELPSSRTVSGTGQLAACEGCDHCRNACPTGAVSSDRFLLRAERCITSVNERPGEWPSWIPASAHNCIVGCMVCQEICSCNDGIMKVRDTGVVFTREETRALIDGAWEKTVASDSIRAKLEQVGILGYAEVMSRNLAALAGSRV
jgi:epoxyqueuosine reductase